MCVCVCVSGGLPPDPHKPSPRNLAWAPHFTLARHQARGQPKIYCDTRSFRFKNLTNLLNCK